MICFVFCLALSSAFPIVLNAQDVSREESGGASGGASGGGSYSSFSDNGADNAQCGTAARDYSLKETNFVGTFCDKGILDQRFSFPVAGTSTVWVCAGINRGMSAMCSASHLKYNIVIASSTPKTAVTVSSEVPLSKPSFSFFQLLMQNLKDYFDSLLKKTNKN